MAGSYVSSGQPAGKLVLMAGLLYVVVCFGVTMTFNQPLTEAGGVIARSSGSILASISGNLDDVESRAHHGFAAGERAVHSQARVDEIATIVKPNVVYAQQRTLDADEFRRVDLVTSGVILAAVIPASTLQ
jgi:hypothetical protein